MQQDGRLSPPCAQYDHRSDPDVSHNGTGLTLSKMSSACLCLFWAFAFVSRPFVQCVVWVQLTLWSSYSCCPSLPYIRCKLSLRNPGLSVHLKGRAHSKPAYDTACGPQELELQLIERDAGTVAWGPSFKACLHFILPGESGLCAETARRACALAAHRRLGTGTGSR